MFKGIKLRFYPKPAQQSLLAVMFGNNRFVWNQMLAMMQARYKQNSALPLLNKYALDKLLVQLKIEYPFLKSSDSSGLQVVNANLIQAWQTYFKDKTGEVGKPRFHSRKYQKPAYTGKSAGIQVIAQRYMKLPKLGYIKTSKTNLLEDCRIKRYTITREPTGKYYLAVQVECEHQAFSLTDQKIGLDLGLTDLAISSTGTKYAAFSVHELEQKASVWQSKYSRRRHAAKVKVAFAEHEKVLLPPQLKDFSNWQKARQHKARLQAQIADKRRDYLHKLTTQLVKDYDVIVIEDLKVKNMQKSHQHAKNIANASWRLFRMMLAYKCQWYGKELIVVSPNYTSQECSHCGHNSGKKPLQIREWTCPKCHTHHDRDINAAVNILHKGLNAQVG